jgi:5-methylcytosine-specific restriction endonuclease McrA
MKSTYIEKKLSDLCQAYRDKDLRVNPEYQRGLQWGTTQKQGLIDSLLRGYEIPIFYVHTEKKINSFNKTEQQTSWIVDGQQRLSTIVQFVGNEFALPDPSKAKPGTSIIPVSNEQPSWTGKKFQTLSEEDRQRFLNRILRVIDLEAEKNEVRELFIRLQAGTPLTAQEKRDAWPGDFSEFVIIHGGKHGHPKGDNPNSFFDIFKKGKKKINISDETHYVDGRADIRKFLAQVAMLVTLRAEQGKDFIDTKGNAINNFYLQKLDYKSSDTGYKRIVALLDELSKLPNLKKLQSGPPVTFTWGLHLVLIVDSLMQGSYSGDWKYKIIDAFIAVRKELADMTAKLKLNEGTVPVNYVRFINAFSGSGSDNQDTIRRRHTSFLTEMFKKLDIVTKDTKRDFDALEKEIIYGRDGGSCKNPKCKRPDDHFVPFDEAEFHHIVEHSKGGKTELRNGILVCSDCHHDRQAMEILQETFTDYIHRCYDLPPEESKKGRGKHTTAVQDTKDDLSGSKPMALMIKKQEYRVSAWGEAVSAAFNYAANLDEGTWNKVLQQFENYLQKKRFKGRLRSDELSNGYWINTNHSANQAMLLISNLMECIGVEQDDWKVKYHWR